MNIFSDLLASYDPNLPTFRPTEIYNEGWLLKLVLHQASIMHPSDFPLSITPGATWFSEALLPTIFKARKRKDPLAESRTNADGVIGYIDIGLIGKADLHLKPKATQFTVVEAKIRSKLSAGTKNALYFNQAARNQRLPLFDLGQIVGTPGALSAIQIAEQHPIEFLVRNITGDWGDLDEEDKNANDQSVENGSRILSAY